MRQDALGNWKSAEWKNSLGAGELHFFTAACIMNTTMKNKYLLAISAGHIFTDMNSGALPAMLPFIIAAGGLKYVEAAGLTFALSLSSTLSQPVFGIIADKTSKTWILPLGVLLAGCGLSLVGFFPNHYWLMFAAAMACGIGIAAFHPEGARMANRLAGEKKGRSMSIFTLGGTIGIAVGPLIVTPALFYAGLRGSAVLAIPAISTCILLFFLYPGMRSLVVAKEKEEEKTRTGYRNEWGKFLWLSIAITCRSIITHSLNTFLPLYWINVLHQSKAVSGILITYMTVISSIVIILGGNLADRFGMNKIIKLGWIILIPSLFFLTDIANPLLAMLMLIPVVTGYALANTPMIVLGQQYLPKNIGFASGITLGLGVSIGGVVAPLVGRYADIHGLVAALKLLSVLPVLGVIVALTSRPPAKQ